MTAAPERDRVRTCRARAKRLGLTMVKRGNTIELSCPNLGETYRGDLDAVEAWLAARVERKRPGPVAAELPARWAHWIGVFIAEQRAAKRSPNTITTRLGHLTAFAAAHPDSNPLTVDRATLIAYLGTGGWTPRTTHSVRTTLRVFFRLLFDLEHRRDDPARTLPSVRIPRALPRPCPDHVIDVALRQAADERVALAIKVALETGLRRHEIACLRPTDVEGRPGDYAIHVVGKGGHERRVPISDELAGELAAAPGVYVFEAAGGGQVTPAHLGKLIAKALPGHWTAHTVRHRFATVAYQATSDLRCVQELLGHTSPVTTAIYTAVADETMRRAAAAARSLGAEAMEGV